jgi:hypothetical protein
VVFPSPKGLFRDPHNTSGDLRRVLDRAAACLSNTDFPISRGGGGR